MAESSGKDSGQNLQDDGDEEVNAMDVDSEPTTDRKVLNESNIAILPEGVLIKTPNAIKTPDAKTPVFKTPEPATPTSAKKRKRLTPDEKNLLEKERQEKRRKLEEEKQRKEQEKLEKAKQREAEKLKKDEEKRRVEDEKKRTEEQKKAERQRKEEEKKRVEEEKKQERLKKEEERKRIEEERKQDRLRKEEDRKRKEDEKRQKIEEKERERMKIEGKTAKQAQFFSNFFQRSAVAKTPTAEGCSAMGNFSSTPDGDDKRTNATTNSETAVRNSNLFNPLPFQVKKGMALASVHRRSVLSNQEKESLDAIFSQSSETNPTSTDSKPDSGYLGTIKKGMGRRCGKSEVKCSTEMPEIQILDDNIKERDTAYVNWRMKLLQFHENRRPPYWGTWKRKPKRVIARRPLAKEEGIDYDFDSDEDWEDEPEDAEEIGDSDKDEKEDQEEAAEGEDDEEGWMVPHGYLSDSERDGTGGDLESMKNKEKEFYKSLKEKTAIGFPFIDTESLSCFIIRLCPVFKSATTIKPVRKRTRLPPKPKPKVEPEAQKLPEEKPIQQPGKRIRKPTDPKVLSNPYEQPSGFLGLELPSEDEDDMDWEEIDSFSDISTQSDSLDSMDENEEPDDKNVKKTKNDEVVTSDSEDDLFIPIRPK